MKIRRSGNTSKPKPKVDPFLTSSRKGYGWCEKCKGNNVNVLNGLELTCKAGHTVTLIDSGDVKPQQKTTKTGNAFPILFLV